jgi:hypothetical protein
MARMSLRKFILSILVAWCQIWPEWASGALFWACWLPGARYGQNEPQDAHFEHFGCLVPDMARMSVRSSILSILAAWRQIWPEWVSGDSFWAFWLPGARYSQNEPQEPYFEHFGCLAPDMARMSFRRFILSILVAWCQIWPEWASGALCLPKAMELSI